MNPTFIHRFRHQLAIELKRALVPGAVFVLLLVCRSFTRIPLPLTSKHMGRWMLGWFREELIVLLPLAALLLLYRSIRADAPSNADTASLTRPIGTGALWLAKLSALLIVIVLPLVLSDQFVSMAVTHPFIGRLAILAGSLLIFLCVCVPAATMFGLASSTRQIAVMFFTVLLGCVLWAASADVLHGLNEALARLKPQGARDCALIAASVLFALLSTLAWWFASVPRKRGLSALVLIAAFLQWPLTLKVWPWDWLTPPELRYARNVTLKLGQPASEDKAPGRPLWKTLRIAGLGKDEVASIVTFAPIDIATGWPGKSFTTDFKPLNGRHWDSMLWVHNEYARPLMGHFPSTDLWAATYSSRIRPELKTVIGASTQPWRLRIAVHELKLIGERPMDQVWARAQLFPLDHEQVLQLGPCELDHGREGLTTRLIETRSTLINPQPHAPLASTEGHEIPLNLIFVVRDHDAREIRFNIESIQPGASSSIKASIGWLRDRQEPVAHLNTQQPWPRLALGLTTEEEWRKHATIQVWGLDFKGTRDFEITPEQLKKALETK